MIAFGAPWALVGLLAAALPILLSEAELATTRGGQTLIINNQTRLPCR